MIDFAQRLQTIQDHARAQLAPQAAVIDQEGVYPDAYLAELGELGGFGAAVPQAAGGLGLTMAEQVQINAAVAEHCGSTGFLVWCQATCAWYLSHAANASVREAFLPAVARGTLRAGTGMSNTVKHLAGIEKINLRARREGNGYVINGVLPWVSNLGDDHLAIVAAHVEGGGYVMFAAPCQHEGLALHPCPEFSGMEGTRTLQLRFRAVAVPGEHVLAHPEQFRAFIQRIKPGFVLGQTGMGLGLIEGSLRTIAQCNTTHDHVNQFLDDQGDTLQAEADALAVRIEMLARQTLEGNPPMLDVLKARLATSELTLRAAQSEVLHAGAAGYVMRHPAQRRLREAVFVAIVTPALKHLRKEIHDLEAAAKEAQAA